MARRATASLLAATMFGTIDSNALVPIIALYAQAIGADLVQTGIIVGLFSLVHAPANLFFGRIADRIGRKLPLEIGLLWDSVSLSCMPSRRRRSCSPSSGSATASGADSSDRARWRSWPTRRRANGKDARWRSTRRPSGSRS